MPGVVQLTPLGRQLANGTIDEFDFVAATIRTLELPNRLLASPDEVEEWKARGLSLFPLRVILEVLVLLLERSPEEAYLTVEELCRIVIPLAGDNGRIIDAPDAILRFRQVGLPLSEWPDCIPGANDQRSAAEFLRFLAENSILEQERSPASGEKRYELSPDQFGLVRVLLERPSGNLNLQVAIEEAAEDQVSEIAARTRRSVESIYRPHQAQFREDVLARNGRRCIITGEIVERALIAAHIIPATLGGPEVWQNGLPLRADVHMLWDAGLLRIELTGRVALHPSIGTDSGYHGLPPTIQVPAAALPNLRWRNANLAPWPTP